LEDLLFLAHRIPYPPNKGDKIRSWNILKHLAGRYRVRLGCLIDDPHDRQYVTELERHCAEVMAVPIDPFRQRIRALLKSRPGSPLSAAYFQTPELSDWVYETIRRRRIEQALVFSTPMMASLPPWHGYAMRVVLDMVDVDSKKWREMAEKTAGPKRWIYWREARTLADFERKAAAGAAYTLLSSDVEAALFAASAPELAGRIGAMGNGVDLDYFSPAHGFRRPYPADRPAIVFTGDMSYWPNIEAVAWFAREVLPMLARRNPRPIFVIVGARPAVSVLALAGTDVLVTGRVDDVRPYLAHADAVVAPLLLARGVQNKVLEAMAMGRPVIATSAAEEGLDVRGDGAMLIADGREEFARHVDETLDGHHGDIGQIARRVAETRFGWAKKLSRLDELFDAGVRLPDNRVR